VYKEREGKRGSEGGRKGGREGEGREEESRETSVSLSLMRDVYVLLSLCPSPCPALIWKDNTPVFERRT
jgi:hypothetical protein